MIHNPHFSIAEIITRKKSAKWLIEFGNKFRIPSITVHKSICYMNRIIQDNLLVKKELKEIQKVTYANN